MVPFLQPTLHRLSSSLHIQHFVMTEEVRWHWRGVRRGQVVPEDV